MLSGMPLVRSAGRGSAAEKGVRVGTHVELCRQTTSRGYLFVLRGRPGVPERLAQLLQHEFPGLQVADAYSPPFYLLTPEEDQEIVAMINGAAADVLWVGLL